MVSLIIFYAVCVMAIPATLFPVLYWILANWNQTREGQANMISAIGLGLLVDLSLVGHWIHRADPAVSVTVDLIVFALIFCGSTLQLVFLIIAQCRGRIARSKEAHHDSPRP